MTEPTATAVTEPAPVQEAAPPAVDPQVAALMARVDAMAAQIAAMHEAAGIPADPIAAGIKNVQAHALARVNSGLTVFQELHDAVKDLGSTVDSKTTDLIRTIAAELRDHVEGAAYVKDLANGLHKLVLAAG